MERIEGAPTASNTLECEGERRTNKDEKGVASQCVAISAFILNGQPDTRGRSPWQPAFIRKPRTSEGKGEDCCALKEFYQK